MTTMNKRKLVSSGWVFDRTREKAASLVSEGATWADTPAALGEQVEVLFTMLADPAAVKATALGPDGFLQRLRPEALWVDCSTVNPSFSRAMASEAQARKVRFLDAPVAGSTGPAAKGELVFFVGGAPEQRRALLALYRPEWLVGAPAASRAAVG